MEKKTMINKYQTLKSRQVSLCVLLQYVIVCGNSLWFPGLASLLGRLMNIDLGVQTHWATWLCVLSVGLYSLFSLGSQYERVF